MSHATLYTRLFLKIIAHPPRLPVSLHNVVGRKFEKEGRSGRFFQEEKGKRIILCPILTTFCHTRTGYFQFPICAAVRIAIRSRWVRSLFTAPLAQMWCVWTKQVRCKSANCSRRFLEKRSNTFMIYLSCLYFYRGLWQLVNVRDCRGISCVTNRMFVHACVCLVRRSASFSLFLNETVTSHKKRLLIT